MFRIRGFFTVVVSCLFLSQPSLAVQDSLLTQPDSSKVYFFSNNFERLGPEFLQEIDTLITSIQKYDPLDKPGNYYAFPGNIGLAHVSMVYQPFIGKSGFDFGVHTLDKYMFHSDSIPYYWVGRPFTHLKYVMGSKKEQSILVDHAQNVSSWLTMGMKFNYINSLGYYQRQESDDKNFVITARIHTRTSRYMILANYLHNKLKMEENGGIKYDSVFEENIKTKRTSFIVNLNNAGNYLKENSFYVKQFFKLNNRHRFTPPDSNYRKMFSGFFLGNLSHSILFSHMTLRYEDGVNDQDFYSFTRDTLNTTYDSTYIHKIENELSWTNADNAKSQKLTFYGGARYIYAELSVDSIKSYYNQFIPFGGININLSQKFKLAFHGDLVTGNSNIGDLSLTGEMNLITRFGSLMIVSKYARQEPGRFYGFYYSNHFAWTNDFNKQDILVNNFEYTYKTLVAGVRLSAVGSFVYMDTLAEPHQIGNTLGVFTAYLRKLLNLGNWSFDARLIYQKPSDDKIIRLPEWIGDLSVYYTKDLFKEAAILQTGFDMIYYTNYYAYAYMPATKSFYIQNDKELGNYPYANFFLNLQIKRARLFLKYYNMGYFLQDFNYYTVPSYPMKDGGFRFGISWMFYD
ncbi:MAG: hypothetical protein JW731_03570 [Bacteroidales bacterium]|nr:hypothetical protein [Bacteroidales bacterium]